MFIRLEQQRLRANTIYGIARNYGDAPEHDPAVEPIIFLKPNSSLLDNGQTIRLPAFSQNVIYETELVILIGEDADHLTPDNAMRIIAGYGVGLDLTARDIQNQCKENGQPWTKAKGFKGAACVSDFIAPERLPAPITFSLHRNGELAQRGNPQDMIHAIPKILCLLAGTYGLRAGDLIFSGTPDGVAQLHPGDRLELDLCGIVQARFDVAA